jgi:hypothetical protein
MFKESSSSSRNFWNGGDVKKTVTAEVYAKYCRSDAAEYKKAL